MTGRGLLLIELERVVKNCRRIFALVKPEDLGFTPQEGLKTLGELGNYLAQIPAIDLRILQEHKEQDVDTLEAKLTRDEPGEWGAVMQDGLSEVTRYMENLTFDEYENGAATAYYGRSQTNAQWLVEMLMNIYHHRALLWTSLKLKGYDVSMGTLYEV